jgi:hypothetical protein
MCISVRILAANWSQPGGLEMKKRPLASSVNGRIARRLWGKLSKTATQSLDQLTRRYGVSVAEGDLSLIDGKWYVTHAGLLRLAARRRCVAIDVRPVRHFCDQSVGRWVFKANVYKVSGSKGFGGYGDADPSNVSSLVRGAEMRIAETRAVNRALRKAYGIGLCSVEELGYLSAPSQAIAQKKNTPPTSNGDGSAHRQPRLRDRLCILIRQHALDADLVKRYAADFCGTQELRDTQRDLVESYIAHLAEWAVKDHPGLISKLSTYAQPSQEHS